MRERERERKRLRWQAGKSDIGSWTHIGAFTPHPCVCVCVQPGLPKHCCLFVRGRGGGRERESVYLRFVYVFTSVCTLAVVNEFERSNASQKD